MQLRNAILIALAFDATPAEVNAAHDAIDRQFGGAVEPSTLVSATVDSTGTTQTSQSATATVDFDKNGMPWDERIHSSSKALTEKGEWRAKRGVDPKLKAQVEAQLSSTVAATPAAAQTTITADRFTVSAPGLPSLPGAAPGLPSLPGATIDPAYANLVAYIAQNTNSPSNPTGRLTDDWVRQALASLGVADGNLQNLAHNPALIPQVDAAFRNALGG